MIEVNDVVNLNLNACCYTAEERSCMDGLKSTVTELRAGFVVGIDDRLNRAEVVFDGLPYTLLVPMDFLKKVGRIIPYAINNEIERYVPGKCVKVGNSIYRIAYIELFGSMSRDLELIFAPRVYLNDNTWVSPSIYHGVFWPDEVDEYQCEKGKASMGYNAEQIFVDDYHKEDNKMTNDIQTAICNASTKFQMETKLLGQSLKKLLGLTSLRTLSRK